jgi:hypothetical protein
MSAGPAHRIVAAEPHPTPQPSRVVRSDEPAARPPAGCQDDLRTGWHTGPP